MVVITVSIWEVTATLLLRLSVRRVRFARPHAQSAVRYVHRSAIHVIRAAAQGFWALAFSAFSDLYQKLFFRFAPGPDGQARFSFRSAFAARNGGYIKGSYQMSKRLKGEVAIITGSDSGIGQATAIAYAREGADIAVTYMHDKQGAEKTGKLVEKSGQRALVVQLDQSKPVSVAQLFEKVNKELGTPTILVNNAGTGGNKRPVSELKIEEWDEVIRADLYGPFYCCKEFIAGLEGSDRPGAIINITSVHQEIPGEGGAAYCAAKGGLRNLTYVLALELALKNIRVNNLAPGMILTPMNQSALDDRKEYERQVQPIPMKRAAQPEEIAEVAVFLASNDASYVHGASLIVDGGLVLNVAG